MVAVFVQRREEIHQPQVLKPHELHEHQHGTVSFKQARIPLILSVISGRGAKHYPVLGFERSAQCYPLLRVYELRRDTLDLVKEDPCI